jgi:hypothetical protein
MNCLRFQYETASLEALLAVHSRSSQVGVSDAPTDGSELGRLNPPSDLSPTMTLSGMGRFIDSDRSPAFSLLVSHPCSYTGGRSVEASSSVRRAGRPRIANGHAGNRTSDIHRGPLGCRGTKFSTFSTCTRSPRDEPSTSGSSALGLRTRPVSIHKVLRFCRAGYCYPSCPDRTNRTLLQGVPWQQTGTPGFLDEGDVTIHRPRLAAWPSRNKWRSRPSGRTIRLDDWTMLT